MAKSKAGDSFENWGGAGQDGVGFVFELVKVLKSTIQL